MRTDGRFSPIFLRPYKTRGKAQMERDTKGRNEENARLTVTGPLMAQQAASVHVYEGLSRSSAAQTITALLAYPNDFTLPNQYKPRSQVSQTHDFQMMLLCNYLPMQPLR
jgi:hypothetical protein